MEFIGRPNTGAAQGLWERALQLASQKSNPGAAGIDAGLDQAGAGIKMMLEETGRISAQNNQAYLSALSGYRPASAGMSQAPKAPDAVSSLAAGQPPVAPASAPMTSGQMPSVQETMSMAGAPAPAAASPRLMKSDLAKLYGVKAPSQDMALEPSAQQTSPMRSGMDIISKAATSGLLVSIDPNGEIPKGMVRVDDLLRAMGAPTNANTANLAIRNYDSIGAPSVAEIDGQKVLVKPGMKGNTYSPIQTEAKPPAGYMWNADRTALVAISGGPAEQKEEKEADRIKSAKESAAKHAADVTTAAENALNLIGGWTTGIVGKTASKIPGTDRKALEGYIDTLKANLSFEQLQEMRNNAKTGGALGQVSDYENRMLAATVAALDPDQPSEVLRKNILKVQKQYQDIKDKLQEQPASGGGSDIALAGDKAKRLAELRAKLGKK